MQHPRGTFILLSWSLKKTRFRKDIGIQELWVVLQDRINMYVIYKELVPHQLQ